MRHAVLLSSLVLAAPAFASGFLFGDNGAKASMQGGAFTAQADDLTALQYNPAGLAQLEGLQLLGDGEVLFQKVTFHRTYENGSGPPACDPTLDSCKGTVFNRAGPGFLPFLAASYGFKVAGRTLTFGLGVFGPPAVSHYKYAEAPLPTTTTDQSLKLLSPQRYSLISNNILIAFPSLSASFEVLPRRLYVGAVLQLVTGNFAFKQNATSMIFDAKSFADSDPTFDSTLSLDLTARLGITGTFGVLFKPLDSLAIGIALRPPVPVHASGKLNIELGPQAQALGAKVSDNPTTDLDLTLPLDLRIGARWLTPVKGLGVNFDFVFQGWNSVDALVVTPQNVTLKLGSSDPLPIAPVRIEKNWKPTYSFRFGAGYDVIKWVTLHAGFNYETSAYDPEYTSIDFVHPSRVFISGGVTGHLGPVDVVFGMSGTPTVASTVTSSKVRAANTFSNPSDPSAPKGEIVGLGDYTSGGYIVLFGVRGHFREPKPAPAPVELPQTPVEASPVVPSAN